MSSHKTFTLLGLAALLSGAGLLGCPGGPPPPADTTTQRRSPETVRPLAVPPNTTLEYVVSGPLGMMDHPESKRQCPSPASLKLIGTPGGTRLEMGLHPIPAGHTPPVVVPAEIRATLDKFGMLRSEMTPVHAPHGGTDNHTADPAVGQRLYSLLATMLLLRPTAAEPGQTSWKDVAWFSYGPDDQFGGLLHVEREGTAELGGHQCERFRWRLEAGLPRHYLAKIQIIEANGLTFYDPTKQVVVAAELEFRFSDRPTAWRFQPWNWLRISLPEAEYTGTELDGLWIDSAFTLEQQERDAEFPRRVAEDTAIKRLGGIARGQQAFIAAVVVDVDGNGVGEPGFLGELSGASNVRTNGGVLGAKVKRYKGGYTDYGLHTVDGKCTAKGVGGNPQYRIQMFLGGADGPIREGLLPPAGDPAHCPPQEADGGWACLMWPGAGSEGAAVLYVNGHNADGEVWSTNDLAWRGLDGGPAQPFLTRPDGKVTWTLRSQKERVPLPDYKVKMLVPNVDVPESAYGALARMSASFVRLQVPDLFTTLPRGSDALVRQLEYQWREAWRDRRISAEEIQPISEQFEAVLLGQYVPGLTPIHSKPAPKPK